MESARVKWPALAIAALGAVAAWIGACGGFAFTVANIPALFGPFARTSNIAYGRDPRQRLDVYAPRGARSRALVIFWYGGRFDSGDKARYRFVGAALANAGYVAVLPNYRLYPQVKFPLFVDDGALALVWAHQHAREYGADPERLYLMGHSAGAWLAAMLAFDGRYLAGAGAERRWVRGFIGLSGPYALAPDTAELHTIFAPPFTPANWQPVRFVDASAPRSLLLQGRADKVVGLSHAEKLERALRGAGVAVEAHYFDDRGHADTVAALSVAARARAPVLEEIRAFIARDAS